MTIYDIGASLEIQPPTVERCWMDDTDSRYAYRCLPLNIANSIGWNVLCPCDFRAKWDGGASVSAIEFSTEDEGSLRPVSHFGNGIITFHTNFIIRTERNLQLLVTGPINTFKPHISSMTAVVESDWSPFPFTLNWKFHKPNESVTFLKGEPICTILPISLGTIEHIQPVREALADHSELYSAYIKWAKERSKFNRRLKRLSSGEKPWQKNYFVGRAPDGTSVLGNHWTKIRMKGVLRRQ